MRCRRVTPQRRFFNLCLLFPAQRTKGGGLATVEVETIIIQFECPAEGVQCLFVALESGKQFTLQAPWSFIFGIQGQRLIDRAERLLQSAHTTEGNCFPIEVVKGVQQTTKELMSNLQSPGSFT
jgi:hypothetical protein